MSPEVLPDVSKPREASFLIVDHMHPTSHIAATAMPGRRRVRGAIAALLALVTAAGIGHVTTVAPAAADTADASTFVPTEPCRLRDTRPTRGIGGRTSPLGPAETLTQQVTGTNGNCNIPSDATGIALNATITNPTADSHLTLHPADRPTPTASNLNWVAGQRATPNKVDVKLSPDGAINVRNHAGTVHLVLDAVGYYTNDPLPDMADDLDALTQRITSAEAKIGALSVELAESQRRADQLEASRPFVVDDEVSPQTLGGTNTLMSVTITAPTDGSVTALGWVSHGEEDEYEPVYCFITDGNVNSPNSLWTSSGGQNGVINAYGNAAVNQRFDIEAGATVTYRMRCRTNAGTAAFYAAGTLTALFTPSV